MSTKRQSWWEYPMRVYQANNFEIDPREVGGEAMAEQCEQLRCNALIVDAGGGISTFYPSKVPYLTPNEYLPEGRDFLAETVEACRKRNIRVFARNDFGNMSVEMVKAHPEWPVRGRNGEWGAVYDRVTTCPSGEMFRDVAVQAFQEQIRDYGVDGIYINSLGNRCYCERCQRLFKEKTGHDIPPEDDWDDPVFRQWIEFGYELVDDLARVQYEGVKAADPDVLYFIDAAGMQEHSWIRGKAQDLVTHAQYQDIVSTEAFNDLVKDYPHQLAGIVSRYVRRLSDKLERDGAVFISSFPGHSWPRSAQPLEEFRSYLAAVYANGTSAIVPWYGHCGREDQRANPVGTEVFGFIEDHADVLRDASPIAPVAVIYSRRTADYYGRWNHGEAYMHGFYGACIALMREHVPHTVLPDQDLETGIPDSVKTLILPNTACLSDAALAGLDAFVENGGSVVASHETARYDEWGVEREGFGTKIFGATFKSLETEGDADWKSSRYHSYLHISDAEHELCKGFDGTSILPLKGPWVHVDAAEGSCVLMQQITRTQAQPPEMGWRGEASDIPMTLVGPSGRCLYFPFRLFDLFYRYDMPDFRMLIANAVRALTDLDVEVEAPAAVEVTFLEKEGCRIIGLINHTSGIIRDTKAVDAGPIQIHLKDFGASSARALNGSSCDLEASPEGNASLRIESVLDYDLIVLEKS